MNYIIQFFNSIIDGTLMLFTHWEIWAIILFYITTETIIYGILHFAMRGQSKQLLNIISIAIYGRPIFNVLLFTFVTVTIIPTLLGYGGFIPISFFAKYWLLIILCLIIAAIFNIIMRYIIMFLQIFLRFKKSDWPNLLDISLEPMIKKLIMAVFFIHMLLSCGNIIPAHFSDIRPSFWTFLLFIIIILNIWAFIKKMAIGFIAKCLKNKHNIYDYDMFYRIIYYTKSLDIIPTIAGLCFYTAYVNINLAKYVYYTPDLLIWQ